MTRADALDLSDASKVVGVQVNMDTDTTTGAEVGASEGGDSVPAYPETGTARQPGLKQLAVRGAAWTMVGYGASQVLRLGSNLVLTRLLFPEAFGLMALVNIVLQGLQMFSDVGIAPAVLRHERAEEPDFVNTAWTLQMIRGVVLWLLCIALAYPFSMIYGESLLSLLIPVVGITAIVNGFTPTKVIIAQRSLQLGRVVIAQFGSQVAGISTMIIWAYLYPTVWSLVGGAMVGAVAHFVLQLVVIPGRYNTLRWDRSSLSELISFGKWIFLSSAVYFVSSQLDRALIGAYLGTALLGIYSIGLMLAMAPQALNTQLTRQVLYPALARVQRERPADISRVYYDARKRLNWMFLPALGLLAGGAGTLVVIVLYDSRYHEAGWIFQALCLRTAMRCMLEPAETCLVALGHPRYATAQHVVRLVWIAVALPTSWYLWGIWGVVYAVAFSEFIVVPVLWYGLSKYRIMRSGREFTAVIMFLVGMGIGYYLLELILGSLSYA